MSDRQVEVLAGKHLIAAKHGAVVVVPHRKPQSLSRESDAVKTWSTLHDLILEASAKDKERFGRAFGKLAAKWAADQEDDVEFGVISPVDNGFAVFLKGGVEAVVVCGGDRNVFRGTDTSSFVDLIVSINDRAILGVIEDGAGPEVPTERGFGSLDEGTVQGSGAILWLGDVVSAPVGQPAPMVEKQADAGLIKEERGIQPEEAAAPPEVKVELKPPETFEQFRPSDKPPPRRDPLPETAPRKLPPLPPTPTKRPAKGPAKEPSKEPVKRRAEPKFRNPVRGVLCNRNHLNDPRAAFCRVDGRRMNETKLIVLGERPPLGFLVLDDGNIFTLENDCVIGREPESSQQLQGGATPIKLDDPAGQLSRAHAEFRLIEWDVSVVDLGSKNGTYVKPPRL